MKLTQIQIDNLLKLNVKGAGGKDKELAGALGHNAPLRAFSMPTMMREHHGNTRSKAEING